MVVKNILIIILMCYLLLLIGIDVYFSWDEINVFFYILNI